MRVAILVSCVLAALNSAALAQVRYEPYPPPIYVPAPPRPYEEPIPEYEPLPPIYLEPGQGGPPPIIEAPPPQALPRPQTVQPPERPILSRPVPPAPAQGGVANEPQAAPDTTGAPVQTAPGTSAEPLEPAPPSRPSFALSRETVENAGPDSGPTERGAPSPAIMKLQILLDRRRISPGVIDGYDGDNVRKALRLFEALHTLPIDGKLDNEVWGLLTSADPGPVLTTYTITEADVAGPFVDPLPTDYADMAKLERLAYRGPLELLAERFHATERALEQLNPGVDFTVAGSEIVVPAVGERAKTKVARIVADKRVGQVRAYDAEENLVAAYPATIGSNDTPSPSGTHEVKAVAIDPVYYYDPKNFVQGQNTRKLQLPPGPNGPVGSVWIGLSKPSYGIHGTPEPARISKAASHGCVRLTNWDAQELSRLVAPGVPVTFLEQG
ncbi:L,D-transpeptidase family protein [Faunimonas sp. B44]|uniref:L,D-transpeptidase family protein n=1 Tax=Faunimonas sp. B44 TaxID=3461493 RepID=UPI0040445A16